MAIATWNINDKHVNIQLSSNLLTATSVATGPHSVRSTVGISTGKYYWEYTITTTDGNRGLGVATMDSSLSVSTGRDTNASSWGIESYDGYKWHNNTKEYCCANPAVGDVVMVAIDADAGKIWFGLNGTWCDGGDPGQGLNSSYSNLSGNTIYASVGHYVNGMETTANFGQSNFLYNVPTGFVGGLLLNDYYIEGTCNFEYTTYSGVIVNMHSMSTGELLGTTVTDENGYFYLSTYYSANVYIVAIPPSSDLNSLIYSNVTLDYI